MEWLEAEGESVDEAVKAALEALGLESPDQVTVEVVDVNLARRHVDFKLVEEKSER